MYPDRLPGDAPGLNETALVQTAEGSILAVMRTVPEGEMYQAFSEDDGKTWSDPQPTGVWGYPAHLLRLPDDRLLLTYGYRRKPMGVRACLSNDGGRTWDTKNEFILRADGFGTSGDLGYPLTHRLDDGTLFTIYYITTDDGITHVAGTHWRLPE